MLHESDRWNGPDGAEDAARHLRWIGQVKRMADVRWSKITRARGLIRGGNYEAPAVIDRMLPSLVEDLDQAPGFGG